MGRATWDEALARLRTQFSTERTQLLRFGSRPEQARSLSMAGRDGRSWAAYAACVAKVDPFIAAMKSGRVPEGPIVTADQMIQPKRYLASDYCNEWFRPCDMR